MKIQILRSLLFIFFISSLSGCITYLRPSIPSPIVEKPIALKQRWHSLGLASQTSQKVTISKSYADPVDLESSFSKDSSILPLVWGMGIWKGGEIGIDYDVFNRQIFLKTKHQFLGKSLGDGKSGEWNLAAFFRLGVNSETSSSVSGPRGSVGSTIIGAGSSLGYLVTSDLLLYTGLAFDHAQLSGKFYSYDDTPYNIKYRGSNYSAALGLSYYFFSNFLIDVKLNYSHYSISHLPMADNFSEHVALSFIF